MKHGLANLDEPRPDNRKTGLRAACNVLSACLGVPEIERWAASKGSRRVRLIPRVGWEPSLKKLGYRKTHVVMEKDIPKG